MVTTGVHAGHGGHADDAADVTGADEGTGSAVIVADVEAAARAPFVGGPHFALSQTRSPLQSVSF